MLIITYRDKHAAVYSIKRSRPSPDGDSEEESWETVFYEYGEPDVKETRLLPHLSLIHRYPAAFPDRVRVDRGAVRFILSGAALMVPGMTSPGGRLPGEWDKDDDGPEEDYRYGSEDIPAGRMVVVEVEGKEHACMIGRLKMGTKEMKEQKKGVAIDNGHFLGDRVWKAGFEND